MHGENDRPTEPDASDRARRAVLLGGGLAAGAALAGAASPAGAAPPPGRTDERLELNGQPAPQPPPEKSAGPMRPGRGSMLGGKVAVVTGAARGIGRSIAVELAANGADVVALDIAGPVSPSSAAAPATADDLAETVRQIKAYGRRGDAVRADIRDIGALRAVADRVEREYGKIDVVVANAAIQGWKPLMEMQDSDWRDQIENNLNGTANTIRAFGPKMVARKWGRIIVVSSMQGRQGTKNGSSYSASKWGVLGLMKSAALELGEHNITVNALIPGLVGTALTMNDARLRAVLEQTRNVSVEHPKPQEAWEARAPTVPLGVGWLQPDDISPAAVFLASDAAALVTGAQFEVTGGDSANSV